MRSRLALVFQLASLALTGWILWGARLWSHGSRISFFDVLTRATAYALVAGAFGAAITLVLYIATRQAEPEDLLRVTLRTSRAAIWFAPAIILFTALSPAAIAAAMVLVVSATRLLYSEWRVAHPPVAEVASPAGLFARIEFPPKHFWREASPALAVSFSFQTALSAILLGKPLLAGAGLAMSLALATVFVVTRGQSKLRPPETLPRSLLGVLLTLILAVGLTVGGMVPGMLHGDGSGFGFGDGNGSTATVATPEPRKDAAGPVDRPDLSKFPEAAFADGGFPGVILWPEVKPYATLIAPMPQRADGLGTVNVRPMSIPFSGEYWMFRWPFARPPRTSYFQRGSPSDLSFKTTDHRSLQMEARHKLEQSIALDCCSVIQVAIRNTDRFPDTIALELVLIDNEHPGERSLSLGRELVAAGSAQTLSYAVPAAAPIASFDEFKIVFQREKRRADQSAKVSIDRFILVPRI